MYLVDDMLYKKLQHSETGMSITKNTATKHIPDIFVESKNYLTGRHFENSALLQPEKVASQDKGDFEECGMQRGYFNTRWGAKISHLFVFFGIW